MPQVPRTELQQSYFNRMLQYTPKLVYNCGFEWRFPAFEPRGWILYEVAEFVLGTKSFTWTDDMRPFIQHVLQMLKDGVRPVMEKYGYQCTQKEDFDFLVGFLEMLILLVKILPNDITRRGIRKFIDEPSVGGYTEYDTGIEIDKVNGVISYQGKTYRFTPVFHLASDK